MTYAIFSPIALTRAAALIAAALALSIPNMAHAQFRQIIPNDTARCQAGNGPAVRVQIEGIKQASGMIRVQLYRGIKADWLQSGRWINRIEMPARAGSMSFCMPAPAAGTYAIAVRHDVNGNGRTDLREDGGGMSNNPSINIFNLGRPSHTRTAFEIGEGVSSITINMRYM